MVYVLFLPLYPITASLMGEATSNTVIAVATVVNMLVTAVYAWHLWRQTRVAADAARKGADASVESAAVGDDLREVGRGEHDSEARDRFGREDLTDEPGSVRAIGQ